MSSKAIWDDDVLQIDNGLQPYEIFASEIDTPLKVLGWLCQIGEKTWVDNRTMLAVVRASAERFGWDLHPVGANDPVVNFESKTESEKIEIAERLIESAAAIWGQMVSKGTDSRSVLSSHIATGVKEAVVRIALKTLHDRDDILQQNVGSS